MPFIVAQQPVVIGVDGKEGLIGSRSLICRGPGTISPSPLGAVMFGDAAPLVECCSAKNKDPGNPGSPSQTHELVIVFGATAGPDCPSTHLSDGISCPGRLAFLALSYEARLWPNGSWQQATIKSTARIASRSLENTMDCVARVGGPHLL